MSFNLKSTNFSHLLKAERESEKKIANEDLQSINTDNNENQSRKRAGSILHSWEAPEFEVYEKSTRWYLAGTIFISILIFYAIYTNNPIMAITFILLGIVGFIYIQKDPRTITFAVTSKGVLADKELYSYENIYSFWIFYEEPNIRIISLHTKASMFPFVHIPIHEEDPVKIRELLMYYIPEIKQETSLIDGLERFLHI